MDLSSANTESILRFHRFHERLNRSIKVQAVGLGLLADEFDVGTSAETLKRRLYERGWLWGGMPEWNGAREDVDIALRDVGQSGVIRAFSAFGSWWSMPSGAYNRKPCWRPTRVEGYPDQ